MEPVGHGAACVAPGLLLGCSYMNEAIRNKIMAALADVDDPALGMDVMSLDMIRDVSVQDGQVTVTAVLVTAASEGKAQLETTSPPST